MDNKFKNINGVYLLKELFFETAQNKDNVVYTLKDREHNGYPSLYECYMADNDPTEYTFATTYLDSWKHWQTLQGCSWFQSYITEWRAEKEIRQRSKALSKIYETAIGTSKDAFGAQKYIAEKWDGSGNKPSKGRPAKADVQREAKRLAEERQRLSEDLERLTGTVN